MRIRQIRVMGTTLSKEAFDLKLLRSNRSKRETVLSCLMTTFGDLPVKAQKY